MVCVFAKKLFQRPFIPIPFSRERHNLIYVTKKCVWMFVKCPASHCDTLIHNVSSHFHSSSSDNSSTVYELCIGILMMCDDDNEEEVIELKLSEVISMVSVNPRTVQRITCK